MNRVISVFYFLAFFLLHLGAFAQSAGDFRTNKASGTWSTLADWDRFDGAIWVSPAPNYPTSTDGVITIQSGHTMAADVSINIDQLTISGSATLNISGGVTLTVVDGTGTDLQNNGTLSIASGGGFPPGPSGIVQVSGQLAHNGASITGASASSLLFNAASTYDHQVTTNQSIPTATWNSTSTCLVSGTNGNSKPGGLSQAFGNFTWNATGVTSSIDLNGELNDISGNLTISSTGASFNYLGLSTGSNATINIGGDFIWGAGTYGYITSTSTVTVNVGGNFSCSSNQFFMNNTGTVILDIVGGFAVPAGGSFDFTFSTGGATVYTGGDLDFSGGILRSGSGTSNFILDGTSSQSLLSNLSTTAVFDIQVGNSTSTILSLGSNFISTGGNYTVDNSAILDFSTGYIGGAGNFTLASTGSLMLGSLDASGALQTGVSGGNLRVSGTRTFSSGSNITYNGSGAQSIGNGFPTDVNLEIDNSSGVSLTTGTTISVGRTLALTNGNLSIGGTTLILNGTMTGSGGLVGGVSSNLTIGGTGSFGTLTFAGTSSLNNFTLNRTSSGLVLLGGDLEILGTLTQTAGDLDLNGNIFTISGPYTRTSGSLRSNSSSSLIISGTGSLPASVSWASSLALDTFTLNRASSTFTTGASLTITNLNLTDGIFDNSGTITIASTGVITRMEGGSMVSTPSAATTYDVVYDISNDISSGVELPSNSTDLNNFTKQGSAILSLGSSITINGDLTLSSGLLNAGSNNITLVGNFVANSTSTLTSSTFTFDGSSVMTGSANPTFGNIVVNGGATFTPNANFNINGNLVNNGTLNSGTGTTTFGGTTAITGSSTSSFNNVSVTSILTAPSGTMNVDGNFTNTGTFNNNNGTVAFNGTSSQSIDAGGASFNHVDLSGSGTKTLSSAIDINGNLIIGSGTTLSVGVSNNAINIAGNWTNNGGTFSAGSGVVTFDGGTMAIGGSGSTVFNDISTATSSHINVNGTASLSGVLTLGTSSTFDADGSGSGVFTLLSDASGDSRIDVLPTGASVIGNISIQRYLPSYGSKRWRNIASTVLDASVSDLQNEILISGSFTGSDNGTNGIPVGAIGSLAYYDNTQAGATLDDRWVYYPASTNTEVLTTSGTEGRGYSVWVRDVGAVTFDLRGTVNQGSINLNLNGSNELWNLVGNPYPSSIDWDNGSGWTKTSIQGNGISVWDGTQYLTWNGAAGSLGNGRIPMGMSFWVQGADGSVALSVNENAKTSTTGTVHRVIPPSFLELSLTDGTYTDKTYIEFKDGASMSYDINDLSKLQNAIFNLSSYSDDDHELAINAISNFVCSSEVPLNISNIWEGAFTLSWDNLASIDERINIILNDHYTGETYNLRELQSGVPVVISSDAATFGKDRFSLTFKEFDFSTDLVTTGKQLCGQGIVAEITINGTEDGVDYFIYKNGNEINSATGNGADLSFTIPTNKLGLGENIFDVKASRGGCSKLDFPDQISINVIDKPAIAYSSETNELSTSATGDLQWYSDDMIIEGANDQAFVPDHNGNYRVEISNGNCIISSETYQVSCIYSIDNLIISGMQVCDGGKQAEINIEQSEDGVYYGILKDGVEISNGTGNGSSLLVDIPTDVLTGGENVFGVKVGGEECVQIDIETPVVIHIISTPIVTYDPITNVLSTNASGDLQWFRNDNSIEGATGETIQLDNNGGTYYVTSSNANCSFTSDVYIVTGISDELGEAGIDIFPNPVDDLLFIRLSKSSLENVLLRIISSTGRIIEERKTVDYLNKINVSDVSSGVFYIEILDNNKQYITRVVKK